MVQWCVEPYCGSGKVQYGKPLNEFKRTYLLENDLKPSVQVKITRKPRLRSAQDIVVGYEDFLEHLALGISRNSKIIPIGNNIPMDVKGIDTTGNVLQTWDMPNFSNYEFLEANVEHVPLAESGFQDSFPDLTHAFYISEVNSYELYGLTEDDLFLYGFGLFDEDNQAYAEDYYSALSPLPLEWGLGYTGIITFILEDDIEYDSIEYIQYYDVVASGTLNTYDDGPVDALKLIFTEEGRAYKDGKVIVQDSFDELLWYSKKGHFLRAGIDQENPLTGPTSFAYLEYQKISLNTATSTKNHQLQRLNYFPNPISAGQTLTIDLEQTQNLGFADLVNAQGQLLKRLDLSEINQQGQLQIDIPAELPSGMYFYRLHSDQGSLLGTGKLQIVN
ncbi:MAG: hypothetical protein Sapg2KO_01500 [Saprospiraceae bacterium]